MKIPLRIRVYKRVRLTVVTRISRSWKKMVLTRGAYSELCETSKTEHIAKIFKI